jgi:hypothetical protein
MIKDGKISIPIILLLVYLSVAFSCIANSKRSLNVTSCASLLPLALKNEIGIYYKGWRILEYSDLSSEDQKIWNQAHKGVCPGVIEGHFDGSKDSSYAVTIIQEIANRKNVKLLLAKKANANYKFEVLYDPVGVTISHYPVIYKGASGVYRDFYDDSVFAEAQNDVIIYEHLEASAIAFVYMSGEFRRVLISD